MEMETPFSSTDYYVRSSEGNFWYERVSSGAAAKEQREKSGRGMLLYTRRQETYLCHDLICFCDKGNVILDKLPFWKLTTLESSIKSIPHPRNVPNSPNVEL